MWTSLDKLVKNFNENQFKHTRQIFGASGEDCELLLRKGVYSYDCVDCRDKKQLPPKEACYSKLNDSEISDEDYEHAQKVWKYVDMKTMRYFNYHNLYLKTNVLLLADVFENFRDLCMKNYDLDSCWYYTGPGLAWDACLKKTGVKLELLSDSNMLLIIEKGIRGGIRRILTRYAKANNKYNGSK